jgi:putative addiction module component (TIGR02574 family)
MQISLTLVVRAAIQRWIETFFALSLGAMIDQSLLSQVVSLSPEERLELIGAVWESLSPNDLSVTDTEKALLDARIADLECNPDAQSPWPDVRARLERLLR